MGVHQPYRLDLCADDEDPSQLIIRPGWDAPHVRCFPRTFCAWPCLLRQVGTVLGYPYDYVVARLAYANPGSRHLGLIRAQTDTRVHRPPCFPMHVLSLRDTWGTFMRITRETEMLMSEIACDLTLVRR